MKFLKSSVTRIKFRIKSRIKFSGIAFSFRCLLGLVDSGMCFCSMNNCQLIEYLIIQTYIKLLDTHCISYLVGSEMNGECVCLRVPCASSTVYHT